MPTVSDLSVQSILSLFDSIDRVFVEKDDLIQSSEQPDLICIVISGSVLLKDGESREEKWEGSPYSSYQMFWEVLGTLLNEEYKSGIEVRAMTNTELLVFRPRRSLTEEGRKVLNTLVTSELVRLQHLLQSSTLL